MGSDIFHPEYSDGTQRHQLNGGGLQSSGEAREPIDPANFVYADTAFGDVNRRNTIRRVDTIRAHGPTDWYASYGRATNALVTWVDTHQNDKGNPTVAGFDGPTWAPFLPLDFDREDDPAVALGWLRRTLDWLDGEGVDLGGVRAYFSGGKGFHVEIPHAMFGGFAPCVELPGRLKRAAELILRDIPFDGSVYDRLRLWRLENTKNRKGGFFKVRLTIHEVRTLDLAAIRALAGAPRDTAAVPELAPVSDDDWLPVPSLADVWGRAAVEPAPDWSFEPAHARPEPTGDERVGLTVAAIAESWPAPVPGESPKQHISRHAEYLMPLAGFLAGHLDAQGIRDVLGAAAEAAGDRSFLDGRDWRAEVGRIADDSARKRAAGARVVGLPTLGARFAGLATVLGALWPTAEGGADAPGAAEPWRLPTPFDAYDVPPFPAWALPAWQRAYVVALAVETQTPVDLAGLLSLAVLATAAARRVVVLVRPGWREPLVLYILAILPPGTRKSAVFDATTAPVLEYERELAEQLAPLIAERQQAHRLAEARLKHAESLAVKAKSDEAEFLESEARARREELAEIIVPSSPQLIGDDVTPEALSRLLHENRERFAVFSAEGDLFEIMAGRYSDGSPNFAVYLKGHSEDMLKVNRVGRPPDYVRRAALSLAITAQPSVLVGLARTDAFRGRGLLARQDYAVPPNLVGSRDGDAPAMPEGVRAAYRIAVRALLARLDPPDAIAEAPTTVPDAKEVVLDAAARARLVAFSAALEPRLGPSGDLHHVADWAGKYAGLVVRFAGQLHLADRWAEPEPWHTPVSAETLERAIALAEYALGHALAAFGAMGADPATAGARQVWRWIADRGLSTVPRADLYQALRGRFPKSADLDAPLALLIDYGYLRPLAPTVDRYAEGRRGPQGRSPGVSYHVNPLALAMAAENPENADNAPNGADTGDSQHFRDFQRPGTPADGVGQRRRRVAV